MSNLAWHKDKTVCYVMLLFSRFYLSFREKIYTQTLTYRAANGSRDSRNNDPMTRAIGYTELVLNVRTVSGVTRFLCHGRAQRDVSVHEIGQKSQKYLHKYDKLELRQLK